MKREMIEYFDRLAARHLKDIERQCYKMIEKKIEREESWKFAEKEIFNVLEGWLQKIDKIL